MSQSTFSFVLNTTNSDAELGFEAWINDQCVFGTDHVQQSIVVKGFLPDDDIKNEHTLKLILKNKQPEHTHVLESGEIVQDACITVAQLKFDDIELGHMFNQLAVYEHNFNGTQPQIQEQFFGTMGCNGSVTLKFQTPMYLWLLEHM